MSFSTRLDEALVYAHGLHRHQTRKQSQVPYITHLLAVASLVGEHGGSEDQVIAALLHDAVEDQGGLETGDQIKARFGEKVLELVLACTDATVIPKPPWRARKEAYLAHLEQESPEVLLVSVADKLHNARTIYMDYLAVGDALWGRFRGGKEGTLWYYRALVTAYQRCWSHPLVDELDRLMTSLEGLVRGASAAEG